MPDKSAAGMQSAISPFLPSITYNIATTNLLVLCPFPAPQTPSLAHAHKIQKQSTNHRHLGFSFSSRLLTKALLLLPLCTLGGLFPSESASFPSEGTGRKVLALLADDGAEARREDGRLVAKALVGRGKDVGLLWTTGTGREDLRSFDGGVMESSGVEARRAVKLRGRVAYCCFCCTGSVAFLRPSGVFLPAAGAVEGVTERFGM